MAEDKDMSELFKKYAAFIPKGYHEALAQLEQKKLERDYWKAEAEKWKQVEEKRRRKWARRNQTETAPRNPEQVWRNAGGQVANLQEVETGKKSGRRGGSEGGAAGGSARGRSDEPEPGPSGSQDVQRERLLTLEPKIPSLTLEQVKLEPEPMEEDDNDQRDDFFDFTGDLYGPGFWDEGGN